MKILVVDDDVTSRELLIKLVTKYGHEAVPAEDGERAWDILSAEDPPNLVLLDRIMPGIDGVELARRIRGIVAAIPPYIIMLTVKGEKADIVSGLEGGVDDYLAKPFDHDELHARINVGRRILGLEAALAARVNEKEILLREVHHRLKNNMATVGSILAIHADSIDEPAAVAALMDAKSRLISMGILYDKLYRSKNVREMPLASYLPALIEEVIQQFPGADSVRLETDLGKFLLPARLLSSLGIIINELATNSMKYAFPDKRKGTVRISAGMVDSKIAIHYEDDGIGLPPGINCVDSSGFGLKLVGIMVGQIGGAITIFREAGTRFSIQFSTIKP